MALTNRDLKLIDKSVDNKFVTFEKRMDKKMDQRFKKFEESFEEKIDRKMDKRFTEFEERFTRKLKTEILPEFGNMLMDRMMNFMLTHFATKHELKAEVGRLDARLENIDDRLMKLQDTVVTKTLEYDQRLVFLESKLV